MSTLKATGGQPAIVPGKVLVKHYRLHKNSADVDSESIKYQYYEPSVYDEFIREDEETGKQNNFVRMGIKTDVIYNPTRDKDGRATDVPAKEEKAKDANTDTSKTKAAAKPAAKPAKAAVENTGTADNTNDTDTSKDKV